MRGPARRKNSGYCSQISMGTGLATRLDCSSSLLWRLSAKARRIRVTPYSHRCMLALRNMRIVSPPITFRPS